MDTMQKDVLERQARFLGYGLPYFQRQVRRDLHHVIGYDAHLLLPVGNDKAMAVQPMMHCR